MRNQNLLAAFVVTTLILFFASQVLAQAPIEGWDKAKFGMTVEEVEAAYSGETEGLDRRSYYELSISRSFRDLFCLVIFYFVDNKLFEIQLFVPILELEENVGVREDYRFWLAALDIEDVLEKKYGMPLRVDRIGDRKIAVWKDEESNRLSLVVDFGGGSFKGEFFGYEKEKFTVYSDESRYFTVSYFHNDLTEVWEKKVRVLEGIPETATIEAESF